MPMREYRSHDEVVLGLSRRSAWGVVLGLLAAVGLGGQLTGAEPITLTNQAASFWDQSITLRAGMGYKDNVLYSSFAPQASALLRTGLDVMLYRISSEGSQLVLLVSGEDTRYLQDLPVDHEEFLMAQAIWQRDLNPDWQWKSSVYYCYQDQIFDASITESFLHSVRARGHQVDAETGLIRRWSKGLRAELFLGGTRQLFDEPLDDYWELTPQLTLIWQPESRSTFSLGYQFHHRPYDHRRALDPQGDSIPGTHLGFQQHEWEGKWEQTWDRNKAWATSTKLGYVWNLDNYSGYYNYHQVRVGEQLRFHNKLLDLKTGVRLAAYLFPNQDGSSADSDPRRKTVLTAFFHGELKLWRALGLYLDYEYENSLANIPFDEYRVNTVVGGLYLDY